MIKYINPDIYTFIRQSDQTQLNKMSAELTKELDGRIEFDSVTRQKLSKELQLINSLIQ